MSALDSIRKAAEKMTGIGRPGDRLPSLLCPPSITTFRFDDDGVIPNHPRWPLVLYRNGVALPDDLDPAAVFEDAFESNGWGQSWRNGIYDYAHYHSRIHEVLGVARGHAQVRFGGGRGQTVALAAGDVAILPAGTGHQCLSASEDFLVVGAYPPSGTFDICTSSRDRERALATIPEVVRPQADPVYGDHGPLLKAWTD